ncbi:MAG TPA: EAL domain-containing protein, partial [Bryobacterales bacterium]|nr:EAL domain-containing protein [Bryobacterales bacterium]
DLSGRFTAVNSVAERLLGYSREEFLEMRLADLVPETQRARAEQILLEQFGGGGSQTYELQFLGRDGQAVAMEVTVHLLFRHGLPAGLIGFARDVTPRKAEQAARQEAERRLARLEAELAELSGYWARLHELIQARFPTFEALIQHCLEVGASPPPRLLGLCEAPPADVSAGVSAVPALVVPVTAAGRPWGFLSFSSEDGRSTVSIEARRFADFLASLIGARLAEERPGRAPAGAPHSAAGALARLDELIRTMRGEKRVCSLILIDSPRNAAREEQTAALERCIARLGGRLAEERRLKHGYEVLRLDRHRWLLLLPRLGRRSDLRALVRCVESALAEAFPERRPDRPPEPLCGVAILPQDGGDAASLVHAAQADLESRRAEASSRTLTTGEASSQRLPDEARLFARLRQAFEQRQFCLRFQPQIQIDGELLGFEALLVWQHPVLGPIPASEFIAAVERSGLIVPLGSWVLDEACRIAAEWRRAGHGLQKIAVNVSAPQFSHPDF